jgi:hypothetical protein
MCNRTDWLCHNSAPHDAPHGCVHQSATGSDVPDRHEHASGGEH